MYDSPLTFTFFYSSLFFLRIVLHLHQSEITITNAMNWRKYEHLSEVNMAGVCVSVCVCVRVSLSFSQEVVIFCINGDNTQCECVSFNESYVIAMH